MKKYLLIMSAMILSVFSQTASAKCGDKQVLHLNAITASYIKMYREQMTNAQFRILQDWYLQSYQKIQISCKNQNPLVYGEDQWNDLRQYIGVERTSGGY